MGIRTTVVAVAAAGALVAAPAHATSPPASPPHAVSTASSTLSAAWGKDAFRAIFFLQGPRAEALLDAGAGRGLSAAQKAHLLEVAAEPRAAGVVDTLVRELESKDRNYFSRFAQKLSSGSPAVTQALLDRASTDISTSTTFGDAAASADSVQTYIPGESSRPDCAVVVLVFAGAVIAVAAFAAVNLAITLNVAAGYNLAAGTNVYYQNNYTRTKSSQPLDAPTDDAAYVLTVTQQFASANR